MVGSGGCFGFNDSGSDDIDVIVINCGNFIWRESFSGDDNIVIVG